MPEKGPPVEDVSPGNLRPDAPAPRAYQSAIVKDAVERNTLVVLPTGLGKTLVSALVCAQLLEWYPDMKVLVMAPTRPLVAQHRESYLGVLDLDEDLLVAMTGHVPPGVREVLWQEGTVFFTTPQIVQNDIEKGRLTLREFSLVVFDEAHRAVRDYAYTSIARHYMSEGRYPVVLGLTASPGGSRSKVMEVCEALSIERLVYRTHEDEDVGPYVHRIDTHWKEVDLPDQYHDILALLRTMLDRRVDKLRVHRALDVRYIGKKVLLSLGHGLRERLSRATRAEKGPIFASMVLQSACLSLLHSIELLESQGIRALSRFLNKLDDGKDDKRSYKNVVKDPIFHQVRKMVAENLGIEHPKVEALRLEVVDQVGLSKGSKVLVFTQYRDTASLLVEALKNDFFVVERFVGQMSRLGDKGLDQEEQSEVLERFRKGDITVLVATSVAEEGLDIPDVGLVVFYEPIPSEIRYIQRRGRTGRKGVGKVVILAARDSVDTAFHFASLRKVKRMREIMTTINTTLDRVQRGPRPERGRKVVAPGPAATVHEDHGRPRRPGRARARSPSSTVRRRPSEGDHARQWLLGLLDSKEEIFLQDLFEISLEEGLDRDLVRSGLEALESEGIVFRPRWDRVRKVKQEGSREDTFDITVKKVFQGGATLALDDGTLVTVHPEDFPASTSLMKKGKVFKARGQVYESEGRRYLRVFEVLE